jgi:FemAB-related protein (PEP-CTERM system-associated)
MSVITATTIRTSEPSARRPLAAPLSIRSILAEPARQAWTRYARRDPRGTLFHLPDWSDSVAAAFGHQPRHLLALRGETVVGVLPLFEVRGFLAGKLLVSTPCATFGGILADDDATRAALAAAARDLTDRLGAHALELRCETADLPDFTADLRYVNFTRELPANPEDLETFLPRKARAAARQAREREGLTVEHDSQRLPLVWELYARSMRRLASINYPYRFFRTLADRFGRDAWVTVAWRDKQPVAGLLSFVFRDTVHPYFVGVDERLRCTGAMNLIYQTVMERAVREGLRRFDFGRSRKDNAGSYRFKENQGFVPYTLGYQRYVPAGRTPPDLTPSNPRFSLARRIWPRLPLALTKPLGAWLSKTIPG